MVQCRRIRHRTAQAGDRCERNFLMNMRNLLSEFLTDERGARTIEYGLLAVGILVAIIATAAALGTGLDAAPQSLPIRPH